MTSLPDFDVPDPQLETTATWPLTDGGAVTADAEAITISGSQTHGPAAAAELARVLLAAVSWVDGQGEA